MCKGFSRLPLLSVISHFLVPRKCEYRNCSFLAGRFSISRFSDFNLCVHTWHRVYSFHHVASGDGTRLGGGHLYLLGILSSLE